MADNNRDDIENSDLEINEIGEISGELFGNDIVMKNLMMMKWIQLTKETMKRTLI